MTGAWPAASTPRPGGIVLVALDDRHRRRSTCIANRPPVAHWHAVIGDPACADATLDRVVPSACLITGSGESMHKRKTT